jgi:sugar lactone lactonase YvrE
MISFVRSRRVSTALVCFLLFAIARIANALTGLAFQDVVQTLNTGAVSLNASAGVIVDTAGNIYIADTDNNQIVEVNAYGAASVLTISGLSPALSLPSALALDGSGDLYIADRGNSRVVMVTPAGVGSVISMGSLTLSLPDGIAVDQSGNLFIADTGHNQIVKVPSGGAAVVFAVTGLGTPLSTPMGLAVNRSGALYIADSGNNRIVTVAGGSAVGVVLSIAGGLTLTLPNSVAVDNVGNVYIADTGNTRVAMVDTAGNGLQLQTSPATLNAPRGVAVGIFGTVYIADTVNNRVLIVDPAMSPTLTASSPGYSLNRSVVGFGHLQLGTTIPVTLTLPFSIPVSAPLGAVKVFTAGTQNLDFALGTSSTCTAGSAGTQCTVVVQFLPVAPGLRAGAVVLYDSATPQNPILTLPLYGYGDAPVAALAPNTGTVINTGGLTIADPFQIALDGTGNMYVGDYIGQNVTRIAAGGGTASVVNLGTPGGTALQNITGVAVDGAGNLFIGDHENSRIVVVTPGGVVSVLNISGLSPALGFPVTLAFDPAGNLYVADFTNGRIIEVSSLVVAGSTSSGEGTVLSTGSYTFSGSTLTGATVDAKGTVYIAARADNSSNIIQVTATGVASELTATGLTFSSPQGVAVDGMGNVYVVDTGHTRVVKITTAGVASILSLSGLPSPFTLSSSLYGVTADSSGNLYIPDWTNNRIVFVNVSGAALTFASTKQGLTSVDSPKTATVTNLGDQPLVFSTNPSYTANFINNSADTNPCTSSTSLLAGTACDVSVDFTPQSVGSLSAGITVMNDTLNVAGSTQQVSVSGTGLIAGDTTSTSVAIAPTSLANGQTATITATVSDTATGHTSTIATGPVTFTDTVGSTLISLDGGSSVNLSAGKAILTGVLLSGIGTHTIAANYAGISGTYLTSSGSTTVVLSKASVTLTGPQLFTVTTGQAGSATITVTGLYSTTAVPSGTLSYAILNASNTSVASGTATLTAGTSNSTASVPISSSLAAGSYTISITYSGDSNYLPTSAAATFSLTIGQTSPTINWTPAATSITYGATLAGILNASAVSGSTAVPGVFTYTARLTGGSAVPVTSASMLGAGSYILTATFAPTNAATYQSVTMTIIFTVAPAVPTLSFVPIAAQTFGNPPFSVSASSASSGAVTYAVVSGPATISGNIVTLTGAGTVVLSASQAAGGNYAAATATTSFTVAAAAFTLTTSSGNATVLPGATAVYNMMLAPGSGSTFPDPVTLSATGLPPSSTVTFHPATIPAGSGATPFTMTIQTSNPQTAHSERFSGGSLAPVALAFLLLPMAGIKALRRRLQKMPGLPVMLAAAALSLGAMVCLSGCGSSGGFFNQATQSYTVVVTATDTVTNAHTSANVTLTVQ